tara:strand:- start:33 stop:320 length:288 start_codon:yes stop_codon:yes gene_type:complete
MTRFHNVDGKKIQFTQAEEDAWDSEEKEWNDAAPARALAALREERNRRLAETDWWAMPDSPEMTDAQAEYRTALRDMPATSAADPANPTWPTKPS